MNYAHVVTTGGLIFDILGAGFLARGLIINGEETALRLDLSYFGGIGLSLMVLGYVEQLVGTWL